MIAQTTSLNKICKLIAENPDSHYYAIVGGMACSKTFSILMVLINRCLNEENTEILVVSHQLSKAKLSVIKDFKYIMGDFGVWNEDNFRNGTEYTFNNGSTFTFIGADRMDIGKGLRTRGIVYFNEANRLKYETFRQIASRSPKVILDWNADFESYIERRILPLEETAFLRLTIYDNENAPENELKEVESYKKQGYNEDGSIKDEFYANLYNVYGLGLVGRAIGAIYTNWEYGDFVETDLTCYGLDFGFSNDPDALIKVSLDNRNKRIYLKECLYNNGNNSDTLASLLHTICGNSIIVADSAEDRLISDLQKLKINVHGTRKNKVNSDIKKIKGWRLIVDENTSPDLVNELNNYIWLDKESQSVPRDKFNHLLDAMRYAFNFLQSSRPSPDEVVCCYP